MAEQAVRWTSATLTATGVSLVQVIVAIAALTRPEWRTVPILVIVAALTLTAALSVIHATLPVEVKAVLLTAVCMTLLALAVVEDVFGLHATRDTLDAERVAAPPVAAPVPSSPARVTIAPVGGTDAAALGTAIDAQLAASGPVDSDAPEVTAEIAATGPGEAPGYRMLWSLRRGGEQRWCGQALIRTASRAAAAAGFAAMIARARAVPRLEPLRCE